MVSCGKEFMIMKVCKRVGVVRLKRIDLEIVVKVNLLRRMNSIIAGGKIENKINQIKSQFSKNLNFPECFLTDTLAFNHTDLLPSRINHKA